MRKFLELGGFIASALLIVFGVVVIALGASGRSTVQSSLRDEQIVGSPDMTPALIKAAADEAGLTNVSLPTCSVAGKAIDTGGRARCFADYMRIHTLESSGGLTYSQMPRFATADGKGTNDAAAALQANGQPVTNAGRNLWVTETALATALNVSFMAERLSLFSIVIGIALLLSGIGFVILDYAAFHRRRVAGDEAKTLTAALPIKPVTA
jgi:hypothetical protein